MNVSQRRPYRLTCVLTIEIRRRASHQITIHCISSNSKAEHRQCNVLNTMATNNRLLQWKDNRRQDLCSFNDDEYKHFHRERREDLLYYFFKWHLDDITNRHYQTIRLTEESLQKNLLCQKEKFYKLTRHLVSSTSKATDTSTTSNQFRRKNLARHNEQQYN